MDMFFTNRVTGVGGFNMKRVLRNLSYVSLAVFAIFFVFFISGKTALADAALHDNIGDHNYSYYGPITSSYLTTTSDGGFMIFDAGADNSDYTVQYYNSSYVLTKTTTVPCELSYFGCFYSDGSNYYVLSGQSNVDESATVEVYRLTKYDKNWNRLSSCSLKDCNTYYPFEAGSADIISTGSRMMIRTCHTMYKSASDGYHHQANVVILVDTSTMTILDSRYGVSNASTGYSSHSFNQYMAVDGNYFVGADHGDAYPRAMMITKYNNAITSTSLSGVNPYQPFKITGETGNNYTGASLGGLAISDSEQARVPVAVNIVYTDVLFNAVFVAFSTRVRQVLLRDELRVERRSGRDVVLVRVALVLENRERVVEPELQ